MTEQSPLESPSPAGTAPDRPFAGTAAAQQDVVDTVRRIMGGDDTESPRDDAGRPGPLTRDGATGDPSTPEVAKQQAVEVADTAKQAGGRVVDTVKDQAGEVAAQTGVQAKQLLSQAQSELGEQAAATQQRVAAGLRSLGDELAGMASGSEQAGVATDLTRQAAERAHQAAGWLADRDPGSLLDEVRSFARRRPGAYLAIALGAGVLAGRLTRGLTAPTDDDEQITKPAQTPTSPAHATVPVAAGGTDAPLFTGDPVDPSLLVQGWPESVQAPQPRLTP